MSRCAMDFSEIIHFLIKISHVDDVQCNNLLFDYINIFVQVMEWSMI